MQIKIMSFNIQHCLNFITREIDYDVMETVISNIETGSCVLMGDFNVQPDNPILNPIHQKLYDTAGQFSSPKFSFPSDNPTVKIDYIFVSKDLVVDSADIPEMIASDHRPHVATIEL